MRLNYIPNIKYPLEISKYRKHFYIYEKYEIDPVVNKRFKTIEEAKKFAESHFTEYEIIVEAKDNEKD